MYLIYSYNDAALTFIKGLSIFKGISYLHGYSPETLLSGIKADYLSVILWRLLAEFIHPVLLNNVLILFALALSILFGCKLFRSLTGEKVVSLIFSLFFSLSLYFIFRVISATYSLYWVFVFPALIYFLYKKTNPIYVGLFVVFALFLSSYYGYMAFILAVFWYVSGLGNLKLKETVKNILLVTTPVLIGVMLFYGGIVVKNIPILGGYGRVNRVEWESTKIVYRPLEDFYNFSFRPWYFLIPPESSVYFGDLSDRAYDYFESTGYFLSDDYQEDEMGGAYMGWHLVLGTVAVACILGLKKWLRKEFKVFTPVYENREIIVRCFAVLLLILAVTAPPSFTIGGVNIYTPSYLLYFVAPIFRVLARFSIVIYLFVLIINSYLFLSIYRHFKSKAITVLLLIATQLVVFAVFIPVINVNNPPAEITFLKQVSEGKYSYAVFPSSDFYSVFWILHHQKYLINPTGFVDPATGLENEEFSKTFASLAGLEYLRGQDIKYLVLYEDRISKTVLKDVNEINPSIVDKHDLESFFAAAFGNPVYSKDGITIYANIQ